MWSDLEDKIEGLYPFRAPKLKITRLYDWLSWEATVKRRLVIAGFGAVLRHPDPPEYSEYLEDLASHQPDSDTAPASTPADSATCTGYQALRKTWHQQQRRACGLMGLHCFPSPSPAEDAIANIWTVKKFFAALERVLKPDTDTTIRRIHHDMTTLSSTDFASVQDYADAWLTVQVESAAVEAPLAEPWLIEGFLKGLGPEFGNFRRGWKAARSYGLEAGRRLPTFWDVGKGAVEDEEVRRRREERRGREVGTVKVERLEAGCGGCGKLGHLVDGCWVAHPELKSMRGRKRRRGC